MNFLVEGAYPFTGRNLSRKSRTVSVCSPTALPLVSGTHTASSHFPCHRSLTGDGDGCVSSFLWQFINICSVLCLSLNLGADLSIKLYKNWWLFFGWIIHEIAQEWKSWWWSATGEVPVTSPSTKTDSRRKGISECSNHMILPVCTEYPFAFAILSSHCWQIIHCVFLHQLTLAHVKFVCGKKCLISLCVILSKISIFMCII